MLCLALRESLRGGRQEGKCEQVASQVPESRAQPPWPQYPSPINLAALDTALLHQPLIEVNHWQISPVDEPVIGACRVVSEGECGK